MQKQALMVGILVVSSVLWALDPLPNKPPVPADNPMTKEKIELGRKLYFDKRLSKDNTVSCNTCHNVMGSGTDNLPVSTGIASQKGGRNSPTVWNAAFQSVQFWDGRAPTLEEQAKGPIVNPVEMGMENHDKVVEKLKGIKGYVQEFEKVFGKQNPITIDNVAKAIATYERTLITPDSPYDRYKKGDKKALNTQALEGLRLFQAKGCVTCHSGPNFSGPEMPTGQGFFQKVPLIPGSGYETKFDLVKDIGRAEATKNTADTGFWRVPSLRNVELTGPYFHNGKVERLEDAVRAMGKMQLAQDLKDDEVQKIVAFLKSLTGKRPKQTEPTLPL